MISVSKLYLLLSSLEEAVGDLCLSNSICRSSLCNKLHPAGPLPHWFLFIIFKAEDGKNYEYNSTQHLFFTEEKRATDGEITTWLHRYVRCLDIIPSLKLFIGFTTAAEYLFPTDVIKIIYINSSSSKEYLALTCATCFEVLNAPRKHSNLRESFNKYIINSKQNWCING